MNAPDPLQLLRRRAVRHAFEDGAIDLVIGVFTLIVGVATQRHVFLALAVVYAGLMTSTWKWTHASLTSRRTGYAELPDDPSKRLVSVVLLAGCLAMGVVAAITLTSGRLWNLQSWPAWVPLLSGGILAGGFLHTARETGFARFAFYAVAALGASVFFSLYPFGSRINPSDRLTLSLFVTAGVLMGGAGATVTRFVRTKPVVAEETGDGR
jgi:hypothetical protein